MVNGKKQIIVLVFIIALNSFFLLFPLKEKDYSADVKSNSISSVLWWHDRDRMTRSHKLVKKG
jgi:hypothetical protein